MISTLSSILIIIGVVLAILIIWYLYRKYVEGEDSIIHLPLQELGYHNVPAFPVDLEEAADTLLKLNNRDKEVQQAKLGLSTMYTIQGHTANAYAFAYGGSELNQREKAFTNFHQEIKNKTAHQFKSVDLVKSKLQNSAKATTALTGANLTSLSLDNPKQFSIPWTTYGNVHRDASKELLDIWAKGLTDAEEASKQFFPTIAKYGAAYNLLVLQKVLESNVASYKKEYADYWTTEMDRLFADGNLYIIDLSIYKMLEPQQVDGFDRFTPATFTWLKQDPASKKITPFAVYVAGKDGLNAQFYERSKATDSTWLYALQAAKTSLTVYGIWFGHVYHWHLVTASMVMTMFNNIPNDHALYKLLAPQSEYIIGFNDVLLFLWKEAAPPTSIKTATQFLDLINVYAKDRQFFDDDPTTTIEKLGLREADFSVSEPWDQYPIVGYMLKVWEITKAYTDTFVATSYPDNATIIQDSHLQAWIDVAGQADGGNIRGLPPMDSQVNLKRVLLSLLYRITVHGISRMENTANPAMSFISNYPPCLQRTLIPEPNSTFDTKELLQYMPNTGTIGGMITFYYTFIYSAPYDSLIPIKGVEDNLFFPGGNADPRNKALIEFREKMTAFIESYTEENKIPNLPANEAQIHQWPLHVET